MLLSEGTHVPFQYVDDAAQLRRLVDLLHKTDRIAIDTEGNSLFEYFERVCLIQLSFDDQHYIVDPLADLDFHPMLEVFAEKPLLLHAADNDLRLMKKTYDFEPRGDVFDTLLAAQLLGHERLGLTTLVDEYLDVQLGKQHQKSNWARRPLSDDQLEYAIDDTRYLFDLADALRAKLEAKGRTKWLKEACARMVRIALSESNNGQQRETWRIKGAGLLSRFELLYLKEVWGWRDGEAQRANRPPFKIIGNQQIMDIAKWGAANPNKSIRNGPRLPRNIVGQKFNGLKIALERAADAPREEWPLRRQPGRNNGPSQETSPLTEPLRKATAKVADSHGIAPAVLASRSVLEEIARTQPENDSELADCVHLMDWQITLIRPILSAVLGKYEA